MVDGKEDPPTSDLDATLSRGARMANIGPTLGLPPDRRTELRPAPHLVVDGKENPPRLKAPAYDTIPETTSFYREIRHI